MSEASYRTLSQGLGIFAAGCAGAVLGAWFLPETVALPLLVVSIGLIVIAARSFRKRELAFNAVMTLAVAGFAASLAFWLVPAVILAAFTLLAFYDIVAVYATGEMVRAFRSWAARGTVFAFVLRGPEKAYYLGTGDVALPAMLAASAAMRGGVFQGIAVTLGAMAGYAAMFLLYMRQSPRRPMAAFPPIALGAALGYLLSLILLS